MHKFKNVKIRSDKIFKCILNKIFYGKNFIRTNDLQKLCIIDTNISA